MKHLQSLATSGQHSKSHVDILCVVPREMKFLPFFQRSLHKALCGTGAAAQVEEILERQVDGNLRDEHIVPADIKQRSWCCNGGGDQWPWTGRTRWLSSAGHGHQVSFLLGVQSAHAAASGYVIYAPTKHSQLNPLVHGKNVINCLLDSNQLLLWHSHKTATKIICVILRRGFYTRVKFVLHCVKQV